MFRTFARRFLPNPLDWRLKRVARKGGKRILLCWNRGLGDIALGLYAMVHRIRERVPQAEITFLTRENLKEGFSFLEGVKVEVASEMKRGEPFKIPDSLRGRFDLVIESPSPTDWVAWQLGKLTPKLRWDPAHDVLHEAFDLPKGRRCIGVQIAAETNYGLWRNWPLERWKELFDRLEAMQVKVLLFGYGNQPQFSHRNLIDLRGKTTLFQLLSLIKHRCYGLVLPDSGISAMTYYLDESFPLRFVTLWADVEQGILKQGVASPNRSLIHAPLLGQSKDLSTISAEAVIDRLFPRDKVAAILLAGGQGTRLGYPGPKGLFPLGGKTLFQRICEKAPRGATVAIMTSPSNHEETVAYFKKWDYFGLDLHFFQQEEGFFLDENRQPTPLSGPNGNGSVFRSFVKAGLGEIFAEKGIDLVTVSYVENPKADLFERGLLAQARLEQTEVMVQCIERLKTDQFMGALVEKEGKIEVVEYTELNPEENYKYAYSGQIAFDFQFFCKMAEMELPLHWVRKKVKGQWIWKGEQFIFDVFPFASRIHSFCVPRDIHYAPVKTREQVESVEQLLREKG